MCTPLALVAVALAAAGTGATVAAQERANDARDKVLDYAKKKNKEFQKKSQESFETGTIQESTASKYNQRLAEGEAQRVSDLQQSATAALPPVTTSSDNPTVVNEEKSKFSDLSLFNKQQGVALAKLGSYGDAQLGQQFAFNRTGEDLDKYANFSRGIGAALPLELEEASQKGKGLATAGTILSALGMIAGLGAATTAAPAVAGSAAATGAGDAALVGQSVSQATAGGVGAGSAFAPGGVAAGTGAAGAASTVPSFWSRFNTPFSPNSTNPFLKMFPFLLSQQGQQMRKPRAVGTGYP